MSRLTTTTLVLAIALAAPLGCQGRTLAPNAADGLRAELIERTRERDASRAKVAELETKVAELSVARDAKLDPEAVEAMPALAGVALSSLSTARLIDPNHAALALVLEPRDGLGRFMQFTGTVRASVAVLIPGRAPLPAGSTTIAPKTLRDAYRSGLMGTHYTIEIPLTWEGAEPARSVSISVEFTDALTGKAYPCQGTIPVVSAKAAAAKPAAVESVKSSISSSTSSSTTTPAANPAVPQGSR